jgi:hypothetical protein
LIQEKNLLLKRCENRKCRAVYRVSEGHDQKYCSEFCLCTYDGGNPLRRQISINGLKVLIEPEKEKQALRIINGI